MKKPAMDAVRPTPVFDPLVFFAGASTGKATLNKLFSSPVPVAVRSEGHFEGTTLILDQVITEGDKRPRKRQWRIHAVSPGHYGGSLTDAVGPVSIETEGNRLHIAFVMKGGFPTQQWLSLAEDGRSAHNVLVVKKWGFTIAVLEETIRRS